MVIDKQDEEEPIVDAALDDNHLEVDIDDDLEPKGDLEIDLDEEEEESPSPSDKAFAEMRVQNKELKSTVDALTQTVQSLNQPAPVAPVVHPTGDVNDPTNWTEAQWDDLAKNDWKRAVDLRAEIKARNIQQTTTQLQDHNVVLEESKQEVLRRHPELSDTNSEKSKVFRNIVTANPEYVSDKKGPVHAMYEMENFMEKNMGIKREDIVKAEAKGQAQESYRRDTVALTSTAGRNMSSGNKVILSKDEQDFCNLQGIDPKTYATNKKKLASTGTGGIQL